MRRFLVIAIPVVTLAVFVVFMHSGGYLKKSFVGEHNIPELIQILLENVDNESWEEAHKNAEELIRVWDVIVKRVQYSSERDEIKGFNISLAQLRGSIEARNKAGAISAIYEAHEHWLQLGN
jgi:hypothetical protein